MSCNTDTDDTDFTLMSSPANIKKVDAIMFQLIELEDKQNLTAKEIKKMSKLQKNLKSALLKNKIKVKQR